MNPATTFVDILDSANIAMVAFQERIVSRVGASIYEEHRAIRVIARIEYQNLVDEAVGCAVVGVKPFGDRGRTLGNCESTLDAVCLF